MAPQQPKRELTKDERWLHAIQQLKNICQLLDGELTDSTLVNSKGETSRKFSIEFQDVFGPEDAE